MQIIELEKEKNKPLGKRWFEYPGGTLLVCEGEDYEGFILMRAN